MLKNVIICSSFVPCIFLHVITPQVHQVGRPWANCHLQIGICGRSKSENAWNRGVGGSDVQWHPKKIAQASKQQTYNTEELSFAEQQALNANIAEVEKFQHELNKKVESSNLEAEKLKAKHNRMLPRNKKQDQQIKLKPTDQGDDTRKNQNTTTLEHRLTEALDPKEERKENHT